MVAPEDADLGVGIAESVAVNEEREFCEGGDSDGEDGGEVEVFSLGGGAGFEFDEGEGDDDEGDGGHEEAEDDVAGGFDAGFAGGEAAGVDVADGAVADDEGDVGEGVEDGVGHGGEEGEGGAGGDGGVGLEYGEEEVGGEGAADGDLVFEVVGAGEDFGVVDVVVDWFEPFLDVGVLCFVEVLELFGFVGGFVEGEGAVAVAFAGGVGADETDFAVGFDHGGKSIWIVGVVWRLVFFV